MVVPRREPTTPRTREQSRFTPATRARQSPLRLSVTILDAQPQLTLVYNQITSLSGGLQQGAANPQLSASGNRAVFITTGGTPNSHVMVVNADGTGQHQIDAYDNAGVAVGQVPGLDISADGSKVVTTDGAQIRVVNADGSGLLTLSGPPAGDIRDLRLSPDGSRVFYQVDRDVGSIERGVYAISSSGGTPPQLVSPEQLATLTGFSAGSFFTFNVNGHALDVSSDGTHVVFGTESIG